VRRPDFTARELELVRGSCRALRQSTAAAEHEVAQSSEGRGPAKVERP
jgi:hypothetical protein